MTVTSQWRKYVGQSAQVNVGVVPLRRSRWNPYVGMETDPSGYDLLLGKSLFHLSPRGKLSVIMEVCKTSTDTKGPLSSVAWQVN